jgi:hypothetical protein
MEIEINAKQLDKICDILSDHNDCNVGAEWDRSFFDEGSQSQELKEIVNILAAKLKELTKG